MKNIIVEGDTLKLIKEIPDRYAELIIADPPYNIGKDFEIDQDFADVSAWRDWCCQWLQECYRVLTENGSLFMYGIHKYICYLQVDLMEMGMEYGRLFIWNYENGFSRYTKKPAAHYEPLLWMTKTQDFIYKPIREPYKSQDRLKYKISKNGNVWKPHPEGRLAGDVWQFPTLAGKRFADEKVDHPTQKPLSISRRIVKHFSMEGNMVFIPFAGSGTECLAALMEDRQYIGFELNPRYIEIAEERIQSWRKSSIESTSDIQVIQDNLL